MTKKKSSKKPILTEPVRKFRVGINPRLRVQTKVEGESMTQQHSARETSIDYLIKRFTQTGLLPERQENYGEQPPNFSEAMLTMAKFKSEFENLPPDDQAQFGDHLGLMEAMLTPTQEEKIEPENEADHPPADTPTGGDAVTSEASP